MTLKTQILGTFVLTLSLIAAAFHANGIPPFAPLAAACSDTVRPAPVEEHAASRAAGLCVDPALVARTGSP